MNPTLLLDSSTASRPAPSRLERARAALAATLTLARDPDRLDLVLVLAQAVNLGAVRRAVARIEARGEGRRLLAERPRIDRAHVDYDGLRRLPEGTLGRAYVRFLDDHGIGPEPFEALPDVADERVAWIMLRMRQTHDLWHVLTGYAPDVRGEILLQAFTYAQVGAPSALVIALLGSLRYALQLGVPHWRDLRIAYDRGREARFLPTFRWEEHWATPLEELRARLGVPLELTKATGSLTFQRNEERVDGAASAT